MAPNTDALVKNRYAKRYGMANFIFKSVKVAFEKMPEIISRRS
jgi:hypothetical protein